MEAYKFKTKIKDKGIIQIPEIARFANQAIEVFIVINPKKHLVLTDSVVAFFSVPFKGLRRGSTVRLS